MVRRNRIAIGNPITDRDVVTIKSRSAIDSRHFGKLIRMSGGSIGEKTLRNAYFISKCKYIVRERERERKSVNRTYFILKNATNRLARRTFLFFYYLQRDIYNNLFLTIFVSIRNFYKSRFYKFTREALTSVFNKVNYTALKVVLDRLNNSLE